MLISSRGQQKKLLFKDMNPCDLTHTGCSYPYDFSGDENQSLTCLMTHPHPPQAECHKQSRPTSTLTACRMEQAHSICPCCCHLHPLTHSVYRLTKRDLKGRKSMEKLGYRLIKYLINRNSNQFTELTAVVIGLYKWRGKTRKKPRWGHE